MFGRARRVKNSTNLECTWMKCRIYKNNIIIIIMYIYRTVITAKNKKLFCFQLDSNYYNDNILK